MNRGDAPREKGPCWRGLNTNWGDAPREKGPCWRGLNTNRGEARASRDTGRSQQLARVYLYRLIQSDTEKRLLDELLSSPQARDGLDER